jgi:hygromycin-B 7''-O-kinase
MAFTDTYSKPDTPDPVLDDDTVITLVRRHVPNACAVTGVDETGGEARTYAIDDDVILKTQRPHRVRPRTSLAKEAFFLNQLALDAPEISLPRVFGHADTGQIEYLCMTRMPGTALSRTTINPIQHAAALQSVGRVLSVIHAIDQTPFIANAMFPGDTQAGQLATRVETTLRRLIGALATSADWPVDLDPDDIISRAIAATPADTSPVALHSNPGPEHVFVDPETGAYTGLIDFGDAYRSHPAFDLATWLSDVDSRQVLAGYTDGRAAPESFLNAWKIACLIRQLGRVARGRRSLTDAAQTVRKTLQQLA